MNKLGAKLFNTKVRVLEMYLDYVNHFLTVRNFSEFYEISEARAMRVIKLGKSINEGTMYVEDK